MNRPRLLYLGFAFPPGVSDLFPELSPAGHLIETSLVNSIRSWFDLRSVGISRLDFTRLPQPLTQSPGLPHDLNLSDRAPSLWHRYRSLWRLRGACRGWVAGRWQPSTLLVCNMSPVYNAFVRKLAREADSPRRILYLADSTSLGLRTHWSKRLRYAFKPLTWLDDQMVGCFDACVAVSRTTEPLFRDRGVPWLWLPNGCDPARAMPASSGPADGPIAFGYFGALPEYTGLPALLRVFLSRPRAASLHICGWGKARTALAAEFGRQPGVHFEEPRTPNECLRWAQRCDVLVNPRPLFPGNENNFSSKVFEYALSGRPVLTTRVSGVDAVLGPEASYFDEHDFERSLDRALDELSHTPRAELNRRGAAVQRKVLSEFNWKIQGERLAQFIQENLAQGG